MALGLFILGLVLGAAGAFLYLSRKIERAGEEQERSWQTRLTQAQTDARNADEILAETKESLIEARLDQAQTGERLRVLEAELRAARAAAGPVEAVAASSAAASPAPNSAAPGLAQRLKRIDSRIAMLPAGSSGRQKLLEERARLQAEGEATPRT